MLSRGEFEVPQMKCSSCVMHVKLLPSAVESTLPQSISAAAERDRGDDAEQDRKGWRLGGGSGNRSRSLFVSPSNLLQRVYAVDENNSINLSIAVVVSLGFVFAVIGLWIGYLLHQFG
jgi:hypothetical protein